MKSVRGVRVKSRDSDNGWASGGGVVTEAENAGQMDVIERIGGVSCLGLVARSSKIRWESFTEPVKLNVFKSALSSEHAVLRGLSRSVLKTKQKPNAPRMSTRY